MTGALFDLTLDPTPPLHACSGLSCQVCHTAADAQADAKIAQADRHADHWWLVQADAIIRDRAATGIDFTTDEVWEDLDGVAVTHEPRALGGVVRRLIRSGVIVQVGWARSRRRHSAPVPVYCGVKR